VIAIAIHSITLNCACGWPEMRLNWQIRFSRTELGLVNSVPADTGTRSALNLCKLTLLRDAIRMMTACIESAVRSGAPKAGAQWASAATQLRAIGVTARLVTAGDTNWTKFDIRLLTLRHLATDIASLAVSGESTATVPSIVYDDDVQQRLPANDMYLYGHAPVSESVQLVRCAHCVLLVRTPLFSAHLRRCNAARRAERELVAAAAAHGAGDRTNDTRRVRSATTPASMLENFACTIGSLRAQASMRLQFQQHPRTHRQQCPWTRRVDISRQARRRLTNAVARSRERSRSVCVCVCVCVCVVCWHRAQSAQRENILRECGIAVETAATRRCRAIGACVKCEV
jgi:hypothetical protein